MSRSILLVSPESDNEALWVSGDESTFNQVLNNVPPLGLATIAGLSVHAVSLLERGQRRRPHVETVRALATALDLTGASRDALVRSARTLGASSSRMRISCFGVDGHEHAAQTVRASVR